MKRGGTHFLLNFMSRVIGITDAKETIRASIPRRMIDRLILFECDQSRECWSAAGLSLVMQQRFQTCNSVQEDYSI
jgi:hypothetical protein